MPTFHYFAVDRAGKRVRGQLDAANEVDLEQRLRRMGLDLVTCRARAKSGTFGLARRISRRDLIALCFHLEQITRSGLPLLDGLADLAASTDNARLREVLSSVHEDMEGGKLLSEALAQHPAVFDALFVSLIRTGEQTGTLPAVLADLANTLKWQDELVARTKLLLLYPGIVLAVVGAVVCFLMLYLVPKLVSFLANMRVELPLQTRLLIGASDVFGAWWPLLLGLPLVAVAVALLAVQTNARARYWWDYLKLRLPLMGEILHQVLVARFANYFALMYRSGIPILDALTSCEGVVANRYVAEGLNRVGQQIAAGESLTESLRNLGLFPPLVIRMIRVGEATGALDDALLNVSYFYRRSVEEWVERALKLTQVGLTLLLGLILAFILWAVLSPIYDMFSTLSF